MRSMHRCERVIFILCLLLNLKVGYNYGRTLPARNDADVEARKEKVSYYKQDPFGPNTYAFGYEVHDTKTGNIQFRDESRFKNGTVKGSFGYMRPDGRITVTHYLVDDKRGYLTDTNIFDSDDQRKWKEHWPTQKPHLSLVRPTSGTAHNVTYDKDHHLNMTSVNMSPELLQNMKEQYGIDVDTVNLQKDVINPVVQSILNGDLPIEKNSGTNESGATVYNFIPPDFPIVPFKLPEKLISTENKDKELQASENEQDEQNDIDKKNDAKNSDKDKTKRKENEMRKEPPNEGEKTQDDSKKDKVNQMGSDNKNEQTTARSDDRFNDAEKALPKSLEDGKSKDIDKKKWYDKVINDTRREFLENIPNLN